LTWRAFFIGLAAVIGISLLDPLTSFIKSYGYTTASCFPASAVFVLVVLTCGLNLILKLIRRGWELTQPELMLIWCMMIIAAVVPCEGLGRYMFSLIAGPPYLARRADLYWEEDGSLTSAPESLILSKSPKSVAAKQYYEGAGDTGRIPWNVWARPLLTWAAFILLLYGAVFFLCAILRRQWVDQERLMFPLARVPLEFTEGSAGKGLLPSAFTNKAFLLGVICTAAFRLFRALPLFFGKDSTIPLMIPIKDILAETPLSFTYFENFDIWPSAVGFAYLVPTDVSLSVWFFFLFSRAELQVAHWMAFPRAWGTWSPLMRWQLAGSCIMFTIGVVIMARRHLWSVVRQGLGLARPLDDSDEPVGYRFAFWGFWVCIAGCFVWYRWHGMRLTTAAVSLALLFCAFIAYARIVAQGGLYVSRNLWVMPDIMHSSTAGYIFTGPGAVISHMQSSLLLTGATNMLAPMAMNAFRISSVFEKRKKLLLPALFVAMVVAMPCSTYTVLKQAYREGGSVSFSDTWSVTDVPKGAFAGADRMIKQPGQSAEPYFGAMAFGAIITAVVMFLRARFYWWPIHPIGLLSLSSWHAHRLWLPFLLGWLTKVCIMKFAGGKLLHQARYFFIGLIIVESFVGGVSALVRVISDGAVPGF
jgi:hypothetical protein